MGLPEWRIETHARAAFVHEQAPILVVTQKDGRAYSPYDHALTDIASPWFLSPAKLQESADRANPDVVAATSRAAHGEKPPQARPKLRGCES